VEVGDADALSTLGLWVEEPRPKDVVVYADGDLDVAAGEHTELSAYVDGDTEICLSAVLYDAARTPHTSKPECVKVGAAASPVRCATGPAGGGLALALAALAVPIRRRRR
jgi:MYXO-CTERM domain-containing protein